MFKCKRTRLVSLSNITIQCNLTGTFEELHLVEDDVLTEEEFSCKLLLNVFDRRKHN
jgi:hypothetical protein